MTYLKSKTENVNKICSFFWTHLPRVMSLAVFIKPIRLQSSPGSGLLTCQMYFIIAKHSQESKVTQRYSGSHILQCMHVSLGRPSQGVGADQRRGLWEGRWAKLRRRRTNQGFNCWPTTPKLGLGLGSPNQPVEWLYFPFFLFSQVFNYSWQIPLLLRDPLQGLRV